MARTKLSEVQIVPPKWLWYPYLVGDNVNLIGGESGTGKTWFLCALMAAVTTGEQPDGMPGKLFPGSGKCLYYGSEDGASALADRCKRQGADLNKIEVVEGYIDIMTKALESDITEVKPALVVFDPLFSFWPPSYSTIRAEDVRKVMDRLKRLAADLNTCIVAVVHPGKNRSYSLDNRFGGSRQFVDAVRSAIYIGWHPHTQGERVAYQCKTNVAEAPPLQFTLDIDLGMIWNGESNVTRKEVEAAERLERNTSGNSVNQVVYMIQELLKANPKGVRLTAKELSKELNKLTPLQLNPYAFGRALNSPILKTLLDHAGIAMATTNKGNRRSYSLYSKALIK